jgi:lipopolysaccharide export system ATP-binding protein
MTLSQTKQLKGDIVCLQWSKGEEKATYFYIATGLVKPKSGKVFLDDLDVTKLRVYK